MLVKTKDEHYCALAVVRCGCFRLIGLVHGPLLHRLIITAKDPHRLFLRGCSGLIDEVSPCEQVGVAEDYERTLPYQRQKLKDSPFSVLEGRLSYLKSLWTTSSLSLLGVSAL